MKDLGGNSYKVTIPPYGNGKHYFKESCLKQVAEQMNESVENIKIVDDYVVLYKDNDDSDDSDDSDESDHDY